MRCIIYGLGNALADTAPNLQAVLFDRQVPNDIQKCRRTRFNRNQSWNDYVPVAMVSVPGAHFDSGELCWGGRGYTASEVLDRRADPDLTVFCLAGNGGTWGAKQLGDEGRDDADA